MDIERDGNLIEAGVWFVAGAAVLAKALRSPTYLKRTLYLLGITLVVFGGSDLVESQTGAWWRPWWLFAWKAICVVALFFAFRSYFVLTKRERMRTENPVQEETPK